MGTNSLLVRTGEHNVLIDTGIGSKLSDKRRAIYDHQPLLLKSFAEAGVSPEDIDIVINTHLHFDHCGWNTYYKDGKPAPTFPRAKYYVQEGELQHAHEQHERDRVSYMTDNYDPLVDSGQMQLLKGDSGDCARHFGEGLSRAHTRSAGGHPAQRREDGVLSQRSGVRHATSRTDVGAGLRSVSPTEYRQQAPLLRRRHSRRTGWWSSPTMRRRRGHIWNAARKGLGASGGVESWPVTEKPSCSGCDSSSTAGELWKSARTGYLLRLQ